MRTKTVIVLDDGNEITIEGEHASYIGLQCPRCLLMFEIHSHHSVAQVHEIAAVHKTHIGNCKKPAPRLS